MPRRKVARNRSTESLPSEMSIPSDVQEEVEVCPPSDVQEKVEECRPSDVQEEVEVIRPIQQAERKVSLKAMGFVILFFAIGFTCLLVGMWNAFDALDGKESANSLSLIVLGSMLLIPGSYYVFVLFCILFQKEGYDVDMMPLF